MGAFEQCREMGGSVNFRKQANGSVCAVCSLAGYEYQGPTLSEAECRNLQLDASGLVPTAASAAEPAAQAAKNAPVTDFMSCKNAGGKCTPDGKGGMTCSMNGKSFAQPKKASAASTFSSVEITSDGTRAGTVIKVNGKEITGLQTLGFNFYNDDLPGNVGLSFTTRDAQPQPGTLAQTTFWQLHPPENEEAEASLKAGGAVPHDRMPRDGKNPYRQI